MRQSAVSNGIPITGGLLEERCRAVWVVNIEPIRVVAFVKFEDARAINRGAIHLDSPIPKVGLEPTPSCEDRILSPARLPFRHFGSDILPGCPTLWWLSTPHGAEPRGLF